MDDQRQMVRGVLEEGLRQGRNPRALVTDLVGQTIRATGERQGGLIGLTTRQAGYVTNMGDDLRNLDSRYFGRKLRDRRFDSLVRKSIKEGKPLSEGDIARITGRYRGRLLKHRAENISRTETITALRAGRHEAYLQLVDSGAVDASEVKVEWDSSGPDGRTRDSHLAMEGQTVRIGEAFTAPDGSRLMFPGDTSLGASAAETIQCRCVANYRIKRR